MKQGRSPGRARSKAPSRERLLADNEALRARLEEAEQTLEAIRSGAVDALVVSGRDGEQVFTLKGADEPYRLLVERINEGALTVSPKGLVLYCNAHFAKMAGTPIERVIASPVGSYFTAESARRLGRLLKRADGFTAELELRARTGAGTRVRLSGAWTGRGRDRAACLLATDVTDVYAAAATRLRVTLASIGDAVIATDTEGKITFINPVASTITGWSEADALNRPCGEVLRLINEQTHAAAEDIVAGVLRYKRTMVMANHTALISRDGREVPTEDSATPIIDPEGRIVGTVLVFRDVTEKRRAAEALRRGELELRRQKEFLELLFDNAGVGMAVLRGRELRYTMANETFQAMLGDKPIIGRRYREVFPEAARSGAEGLLLRVIESGEPWKMDAFPAQLPGKPGTLWQGQVVRLPFERGDEPSAVAVFLDVTERKRVEAALRDAAAHKEASERVRSLIEASLDPFVTISPEGTITDVNEATIKATGVARAELVGTDFSSYFTEPARAAEAYRQAFEKGLVTDFPLTIRHQKGRLMHVLYNASVLKDARGSVRGVFAAARDVTAHKHAEEKAAKERKRLLDVLEALPAMICLLTPDHHVAFANRGFREKFGEAQGRACYEHCFGLARPCSFCETFTVLQTGKPHHWELTTPDGTVIDAYDFPFKDVDGSPMVLEMDFDITERRRAEEDLRATQERLGAAERLSDIGVLAATVAHELRNPLAAIRMATTNVRRKAGSPAIERHLANIEKKVFDSDQIINNLLFYSKLKPPHVEDVRLDRVLQECVEQCQLQAAGKKDAVFETDPASTKESVIRADPLQLKEVFTNILNNALDALGPVGGRIEILTKDRPDSVDIRIRDNGSGIDEADLARVFDPFFSTKAKGTGLGLAVCQQIVNVHHGKIRIESVRGKGTSVFISLRRD